MNYLCKADAYLNSVTETFSSLCEIILSDKLQSNAETQYKIAVALAFVSSVLPVKNVNVKKGQVKFHKIISFYSCCGNALVFTLQGHFFCP